jgi:hypothetical protein
MTSFKAINQIEEVGIASNVACSKSERDLLGLVLILLSSILLGIWAVKGTIALRNILLGLETVLSILYCYRFFKTNTQKIPLQNWIPIIMLGMMFCWVIFHYLFLSRFQDIQLHELKSTWFRAFLAAIVGFGTGLAILRGPNTVALLWVGIFISFSYLFYQYLPLPISAKNINYYRSVLFIYSGKINGAIAGTILIAGLSGTLLDRLPNLKYIYKIALILFWLTGICFVLYVYVYIFDTRNGISVALAIFGFISVLLLSQILYSLCNKSNLKKITLNMFLLATLVIVGGSFGSRHVLLNANWIGLVEDVAIAYEIEKYPNWQNPRILGHPNSSSGRPVNESTYERISWALAGMTIFVPENPWGVGVLGRPFGFLLNAKYSDSGDYITSTHSAWIDITLAFGFPGLIFTLGSLLTAFSLSFTSCGQLNYLPKILSFGIIFLYAIGETSSQHSIEILAFIISLLSTCLFPIGLKKTHNQ